MMEVRKSGSSARCTRVAAIVCTMAAGLPAAMAGSATPVDESGFRQLSKKDKIAAKLTAMQDEAEEHADDAESAGRCVTLNGMSILFPVSSTEAAIESTLEQMPDEQFAFFLPQGSRWTSTATNGAVSQGQRLTLTYSFVPDGTPLAIAGFPGSEGSSLFAVLDQNFPGGQAAWKAAFASAMNRWGELVNITYVEVSDDGAAFPASAGALGSRGDVRIAMRSLGEPLAVNFFPQFGGDMVLDSEDIGDFINSSNNFRTLHNTLTHEHGHGIGLNHVLPSDGTKLMEPFLNVNFDGPQEDDIRGGQFIYGDVHEANNTVAANSFVGGTINDPASVGVQVLRHEDLAVERSGESDFYGFTAFAGAPIAIRVDPVGTSYSFAPQNNPNAVTTVNAKAVRNLGLRLWRRTSAANNTFELFAQIDFNPAGEGEYHPPIPYQIAGFMVAEVFSNDGINDCQRYTLTISNSDIQAPEDVASMSVFNIAAGQQIFDGTTVQFGQTDLGDSSNVTLTIGNGGPGPLEIGQISLAGPGAADYTFNLLGNPVAVDGAATLGIGFNPTAPGVRQAVLTIPNNDPSQPEFGVVLSGLGVEVPTPVMVVESDGQALAHNQLMDFGDIDVGGSGSVEFVLRNTGNATLNAFNVAIQGGQASEFTSNLNSATLSPGASVTMSVTATPGAEGTRIAQVQIFSNSVPNPFTINLTVNGVEPEAPITDCNVNGIDDAEEIAQGASGDCNANGVPDECEADTDGDTVIDDCDQCPGLDDTVDLNGNGTPDCLDVVDNNNGNDNENDNNQGDNNENNNNQNDNGQENENDNDNDNANDNVDDDKNQDQDDIVAGGLCGPGGGLFLLTALLMLTGGGMSRRRRRSSQRRSV